MLRLDRPIRILVVTGLVAVFAAGAIWVTPKKGEPGPIGLELAGNREALGRALAGAGPPFGNVDGGAAPAPAAVGACPLVGGGRPPAPPAGGGARPGGVPPPGGGGLVPVFRGGAVGGRVRFLGARGGEAAPGAGAAPARARRWAPP